MSSRSCDVGVEAVESVAPLRAPACAPVDEERDTAARFAERAVALPVTRCPMAGRARKRLFRRQAIDLLCNF